MSATKAAPRSSRPTSVREDANTPPKYSVDTMLCSRLRARRPSWSRPSRSVSLPDSQRRRSSSERTAHRKEELNIRIAWDHPRRSGRYTQPASTWLRAHLGFYAPSPATLSFRHRAPAEVEESAAPRYQPCHPEPPTRFQRVKRAMNQRHRWCCKPGVAEGMLIAIMVVGSRPAMQWCF